MHVRIGWGRKLQIRGARFEKQTEPDVVRRRNGMKQDWFPLVSWECFVRFSFLQMSCRALCPNDIFAPSGPAGEPKDVQCRTTGAQLVEGQLRIARWHPQCNELLSSTDLASGSSVQLTWLAQTLRRHTQSRVGLLKWKTGRELLGLADVMTGEARQFCVRFSYTDGLRVLSKADHRRLIQDAELVSPFLLEYHCMSLPECQL